MNTSNQILLIGTAALVLLVAGILVAYLWNRNRYKNGVYGQNTVGAYLKRYCLSRNFKVLSQVSLNDGHDSINVDHILVGFFGILFVKVVQVKEELYADLRSDTWSIADDERKIAIPNPVKENERQVEAFRTMLSRKKIYRIPVEPVTVVVSLHRELKFYLTNTSDAQPNQVMDLKRFKRYLEGPHFEKDNDMDVEALVATIREWEQ